MDFYTNRLHIRPVNIKDSKSLFNYRSDSETNRFLSLVPETIEEVSDFICGTSSAINIPGTCFNL